MIISKILQTANTTLEQLHEEFSPEEQDDALSFIGVGPRAIRHYLEQYPQDQRELVLNSFLMGVIADRLSMVIGSDTLTQGEAMTLLLNGDEPYGTAAQDDIQDVLQVSYGIETDPEASMASLMEMLMEVLKVEMGHQAEDPQDEGQDPIDSDKAA